MIIVAKRTVGGEFRLITRNPDGSIGQDTGWFDNMILDGGLINMTVESGWASYFHVGESAAPPVVTQSTMANWLASSTTTTGADTDSNAGAPDYQGITTRGRRFIAGSGSGTVRQVGTSNASANSDLTTLVQVVPEVNWAITQTLDVFYRFTNWPDLENSTGVTSIFGDDYNYIARIGRVSNSNDSFQQYEPIANTANHQAWNGDIGGIDEGPAGDNEQSSSVTIISQTSNIVAGTFQCDYEVKFGLNSGNVAGGIRSISSEIQGGSPSRPIIQVQFNRIPGGETIPKNNTREITFTLRILGGRHTP